MDVRPGNQSNHYPTPDRRHIKNGHDRQYLENSCLKYFDSILRQSATMEQFLLRDQSQTYFASRRHQSDRDDPSTWQRIRQCVSVGAEPGLDLQAGFITKYIQSSNEYQVYALQTGSFPSPDDDPFCARDLVWQDELALIVKPSNEAAGPEISVVDPETGQDIDDDRLSELIDSLCEWEEPSRTEEVIDALSRYVISVPTITLSPDEAYNQTMILKRMRR